MKVTQTDIPGVLLIEPKIHGDERGFFVETWRRERYAELGMPRDFVQDNMASSKKGVLRGLHLQHPNAQGKLVQVLDGEVFDVAVDVRRGSPWFGKWVGVHLDGKQRRQFWVPPGFAHGYVVLSEMAVFSYKCSDFYHPEYELSVLWNDPAIGIEWPTELQPTLSDKDRNGLLLNDISPEKLPEYEA